MASANGRSNVPGQNAVLSALAPDERERLRLEKGAVGVKVRPMSFAGAALVCVCCCRETDFRAAVRAQREVID